MTEPSKPPVPEGAKRQLNLEIPGDLAATYANFAIISHSPWEIFLDFAQILPNAPKARVRARLVLTPANAKMLLRALQDNIARYEQQHGEINLPPRAPTLADQLFRTIRTDDPGDAPDEPESEPDNE